MPCVRVLDLAILRTVSCALALLLAAACGKGGEIPEAVIGDPAGNARLLEVEWGRLVDVYGLQDGELSLYRSDVLIGFNIQDERPTGSSLEDEEVVYDVLSTDLLSLQSRLLITREVASDEFARAFEALDDQLVFVAPGVVGQNTGTTPFSVVPRNAALRLTFSRSLNVDDGFFTAYDEGGQVQGFKNTEAVQLLQVRGRPGDPSALAVVPTRILGRGRRIVLDPVFLGSEGVAYGVRNNASGVPAAPDSSVASMRIAVALDGPLAIPGVQEDSDTRFLGVNNSGVRSVIRDFRAANAADDSLAIAGGFIRDPVAPRLLGEVPMLLESVAVSPANPRFDELTLFKDGAEHDLDAGDTIQFSLDGAGGIVASAEILEDPEDDASRPRVQRVRVRVRRSAAVRDLDPQRLPGFPLGAPRSVIEDFLRARAPRALAVVEYRGPHESSLPGGGVLADDPRYFVRFSGSVLPGPGGERSAPAENVSPYAGLLLRFSKPMDLASIKSLDTAFLATRDLLDRAAMEQFIRDRGIDPGRFDEAKYRTPHLVYARPFDEGSQTAVRLQPPGGLYLDDAMRDAAAAGQDYRYFLHLLATPTGIRDLAGNALDLQADSLGQGASLVIPFTIDARRDPATGEPYYRDNLVVSVCRRLEGPDEDELPSYYMPREADPNVDVTNPLTQRGLPWPARMTAPPSYAVRSQPVADWFGAFFYADGALEGRPPGRVQRFVDNLNQQPVAQQTSNLRWCPLAVGGQNLVAANTANTLFGQGIQNPLNPFGARLQMVWRELDLSLSRVDPSDFNLDVERMYWAPGTGAELIFDEFDSVSLYFGHSEQRPEPCLGEFSSLPEFTQSGLGFDFARNYVFNPALDGTGIESQPAPHAAFENQPLIIDPALALTEPNGINRYLPFPEFQEPYFVFRDETVAEQGGDLGRGSDTSNGAENIEPYLASPFMGGRGLARDWLAPPGGTLSGEVDQNLTHHNQQNFALVSAPVGGGVGPGRNQVDDATGGLLPAIALPLLAEVQTACDLPHLPMGAGYTALGVNGWQVALSVTSWFEPNFRVYSAGAQAFGSRPAICADSTSDRWSVASGGFALDGSETREGDNTVYWAAFDFLQRQSVATSGFLDLRDPHRVFDFGEADPQVRSSNVDPRLGPFLAVTEGSEIGAPVRTHRPVFVSVDLEHKGGAPRPGTSIAVEFRGASAVERVAGDLSRGPWKFWEDHFAQPPVPTNAVYNPPTRANVALDPRKAGDAHLRKLDRRLDGAGQPRDFWTHYYSQNVTGYVEDPSDLLDDAYLAGFRGPGEEFGPLDLAFVNWRFVMGADVSGRPGAAAPAVESFALTYRFESVR